MDRLIEVGRVLERDYGSYKRYKVYYLGWIRGLSTTARFIHGLQGKETEVTMDTFWPIGRWEAR